MWMLDLNYPGEEQEGALTSKETDRGDDEVYSAPLQLRSPGLKIPFQILSYAKVSIQTST